MRKFTIIIFLFALVLKLNAQEAQNIADLDFLYKSIQELSSYKDQLKDDTSYTKLYEKLRNDLKTNDDFEVYQKLLQLIYPINDNHLGLYHRPDSTYKFKYLLPKIDISKLDQKFNNYSLDSLEGFYYDFKGTTKYIVYEKSKNVYYLQNLKTNVVEAILNKINKFQNYDVIRFLGPPVPYVLYKNVKLSNSNLVGLPYQKTKNKSYVEISIGKEFYEYKKLEDNIGYLRLSSFSSQDEIVKNATDFFIKAKNDITEKNLIVDVRNNGGGGYKNSRQFITFLKNFNGKVYILQNAFTASNAEQFIINLKDLEHIITLGETTLGKITYGSNYGKTITLPSNRFLFYPTDMGGSKKELAFESIGVKPKVTLKPFTEDWITQTIKYIKAN